METNAPKKSLAIPIFIGTSLACFSVMTIGLFRSVLRDYLSLNETQYGILLGIGIFSGAAGSILAGLASRKNGPFALLKVILLLCGIGYAIVAFSNSFAAILTGLFICGFASQATVVCGQGALPILFPEGKRKILSAQMVFCSCCNIAYATLAEAILKWSENSPHSFGLYFHGCFLLVCLLLFLMVPLFRNTPKTISVEQNTVQKDVKLQVWPAVLTFCAMLAHGLADNLVFLWMPRVLEQPGYDAIKPGYVFSAVSLAYVVSRSLLACLRENSFRRGFLCLPGISGALVLGAGLLIGGRWTALCYIAGASLWSCGFPSMMAQLGRQVSPRLFTTWLATYYAVSGVLTTFGSSAFGRLADTTSLTFLQMLFFPVALFATVSLLCTINAFTKR